jgi:cytochrome oxidase assembly protein ShyY1
VSAIIVAFAVAAMIGLGVWQLARLQQKQAALAAYRANMHLPQTAFPARNPTDESYLFRSVSAYCLQVVRWQVIGGRSRSGAPGWRHIAHCTTGAEGPGLLVDMGVSTRPDARLGWIGGPVSGLATHEPDAVSAFVRLTGGGPPLRLMIVSERAAPGLAPSPRPDPAAVPNNHLSYAVQWFLFAGLAILIYALALRKRWRESEKQPPVFPGTEQ